MTTAVKIRFADASPAEIREAILPENQPEFDRQWRAALAVAADALSLDEVHKILASWRLMARQVSAQGPAAWRRLLSKAEHTLQTGERPSGMVPTEKVDELIRERLGR